MASGSRHLTASRISQKVPQGPSPCSSLSSGTASVTPPNDVIVNERGMPHRASTPTGNSVPNSLGTKGGASATRQEEEHYTHPHQGAEERTHRRQGSDTTRSDKLKLFSHLKRSPNHSLFRVRSNIEQSPTKKQQQQQQQQPHTFVQSKGNPVSARISQFGGSSNGLRGGSVRDQKKQPQYARPEHSHDRKQSMTRHLSSEDLTERSEDLKLRRTHERKESDSSEEMKSHSYPLLQGGRKQG